MVDEWKLKGKDNKGNITQLNKWNNRKTLEQVASQRTHMTWAGPMRLGIWYIIGSTLFFHHPLIFYSLLCGHSYHPILIKLLPYLISCS